MLKDLVRTEAAEETPVSLDEIKQHLGVDHDDDNDLLDQLNEAATEELDGYGGVLRRCLGAQTWVLHLPCFPRGRLQLPLPPLIDVVSITYVDPTGNVQTMAEGDYLVLDGPISAVDLAPGKSWASTRKQARAVSVTFVCGLDPVPARHKAIIKLVVGDLYANREAQLVARGTLTVLANQTVRRLIRLGRIPRT